MNSKQISILLVCAIGIFWMSDIVAQTDSSFINKKLYGGSEDYDIDPRQFISIYQKRAKVDSMRIIYNQAQVEKFRYLDKQSKVIIQIDKLSLAHATNFTGSISLEAFLDERKIPISGYSSVGVEQNIIGNDGMSSTSDFASSFFGLIYETGKFSDKLMEVNKLFASVRENDIPYSKFIIDNVSELKDASKKLKESSKNYTTRFSKELLIDDVVRKTDYSFFNEHYLDGDYYYGYPWPNAIDTSLQINEQLNALVALVDNEIKDLEKELEEIKKDNAKFLNYYVEADKALNSVYFEIPLLVNYLNFLNNSNTETSQAFSKSINRDPIFVRFITSGLISATDAFNSQYKIFLTEMESDLPDKDKLESAYRALQKPISDLNSIVKQLAAVRDDIIIDVQRSFPDDFKKLFSVNDSLSNEFNSIYKDLELNKKYLDRLAYKSGLQIYKKLIDGVIDLEAENPRSGSVLRIYVVWYNRQGKNRYHIEEMESSALSQDLLEVPKENLLLAKYEIKEIGWRLKVSDAFLLVNRLNPPDTGNVSPSRYKGAAGVSLLWTYGNGFTAKTGFGRFLGRIEPSFGINVSYVDFSTEKDIEIALGAIIGFFSNRVFITAGANLNVKESPWYFGVGLSFANIAGKVGKKE